MAPKSSTVFSGENRPTVRYFAKPFQSTTEPGAFCFASLAVSMAMPGIVDSTEGRSSRCARCLRLSPCCDRSQLARLTSSRPPSLLSTVSFAQKAADSVRRRSENSSSIIAFCVLLLSPISCNAADHSISSKEDGSGIRLIRANANDKK